VILLGETAVTSRLERCLKRTGREIVPIDMDMNDLDDSAIVLTASGNIAGNNMSERLQNEQS
jgi:hypothetical protein